MRNKTKPRPKIKFETKSVHTTVRLTKSQDEFLLSNFPSRSAGIAAAIECLIASYEQYEPDC